MLTITLSDVGSLLQHPFLIMIVDKLLVGMGIALILFWAQKRLEDYKAQQTLKSEVAKKRVEHIATGWSAVNAWDLAVETLLRNFASLLREQQSELSSDAGIDCLGHNDLLEIGRMLSKLKSKPLAMQQLRTTCRNKLRLALNNSKKESVR